MPVDGGPIGARQRLLCYGRRARGRTDYEQRFTANAKDLDKLFKDSGSGAHVYTLSGPQATKAHLTETLTSVAHDAKAEDDFVLILIGHGSYDGTDYKFNLVGPDITAAELATFCDRIPARRQLIVNATSASGDRSPPLRSQVEASSQPPKRHRKKCDCVRALLG